MLSSCMYVRDASGEGISIYSQFSLAVNVKQTVRKHANFQIFYVTRVGTTSFPIVE